MTSTSCFVLPPENRKRFIFQTYPESPSFTPAKKRYKESWAHQVSLGAVDKTTLKRAMEIAWRKRAPKDLL